MIVTFFAFAFPLRTRQVDEIEATTPSVAGRRNHLYRTFRVWLGCHHHKSSNVRPAATTNSRRLNSKIQFNAIDGQDGPEGGFCGPILLRHKILPREKSRRRTLAES